MPDLNRVIKLVDSFERRASILEIVGSVIICVAALGIFAFLFGFAFWAGAEAAQVFYP